MTARQDFANYCLQKLGAPLINIEIADVQIENCISEAISYYHEYHYDGMERDVFKHQITAQDLTNQYIEIPDGIVGILKVLPYTGVFTNDYLFSGQYQFWLSEMKFLQNYNTSNFYISMDYLNHVNFILNKEKQFRFSRRMNKLFLDVNWENLAVDQYLILEVYRELDPDLYPSIYHDRWLREYATALMKQQWGQNLSKYDQMQLPGGVLVNGWRIKEEALQEKQALEEQLRDLEGPLEFGIG